MSQFRAYLGLYWDKKLAINFIPGTETQTWIQMSRKKVGSQILLAINKQNNMHTTPPHTHIALIIPRPKGIGSRHTCDNRWFNCKESQWKKNNLSALVIPLPTLLNDRFINPPQMSLVSQQSSSSSQNTTPDPQASSITGHTSADLSNTMPPPFTKKRNHNICVFMVDVSNLALAQWQNNAIMLLQHYHKFCNTTDPL